MLVQKLLAVAQVGSQVVLYLLLGLSVLSIGVVIDRIIFFARRRVDIPALGRTLVERLRQGDVDGARALLEGTRGIEAEVLHHALAWYHDGSEAFEQLLQNGIRERRKTYESGLLFLGTLGNNAPFIGLFGTVLGIVTAFRELGQNAAGAMGNVMGGIAEALVATAIGILVALPAVVAYNIFQKKSTDIEENVASLGNLVLAQMKSVRDGVHAQSRAAEAKVTRHGLAEVEN